MRIRGDYRGFNVLLIVMLLCGSFGAVNRIIISLKGKILVSIPEISGSIQARREDGTFPPGVSGNPAGKPPGTKNSVNLGGPITQETLDKLETFSKTELIKLIRKVSGAIWGIGIMSDDEAYEAVRLKLLHTGLTSESANSSLNVLKEWIDRTKGKAPQSISMKVETDPLGKLSADRLLALEKTLAKVTGQDAMIIPPMPELLQDDS